LKSAAWKKTLLLGSFRWNAAFLTFLRKPTTRESFAAVVFGDGAVKSKADNLLRALD